MFVFLLLLMFRLLDLSLYNFPTYHLVCDLYWKYKDDWSTTCFPVSVCVYVFWGIDSWGFMYKIFLPTCRDSERDPQRAHSHKRHTNKIFWQQKQKSSWDDNQNKNKSIFFSLQQRSIFIYRKKRHSAIIGGNLTPP